MGERYDRFCRECGNPLGDGERFCGNCGTPVLSAPMEATQVIPRDEAASHAPPARSRRWPLVLGVATLAVILLGTLVVGVLVVRDRLVLSNDSDPRPVAEMTDENTLSDEPTEATPATNAEDDATPETEPSTSYAPSQTPDRAFDGLLPTLKAMTDAPIMLPSDLPEELYVAISDGTTADAYGIVFVTEEGKDIVVQPYTNASSRGIMSVEASGPGPQFPDYGEGEGTTMTPIGEVTLPDGTPATLRYYEPTSEYANFGPFVVGGFVKSGDSPGENYLYLVNIEDDDPEGTLVRQILSTMVPVPDDVPASEEPEASVEQEFVTRYYDAVALESWYETYRLLDSASQAQFTEEEWSDVQDARVAATSPPPFVSATVQSLVDGGSGFTADILLTYGDGTEEIVTIQTVYENGEIRRVLTDDDVAYLNGLVGETDDDVISLAYDTAESFVYQYYDAVGQEDWSQTYAMLDSYSQSQFTESEWIEKQAIRQATTGAPAEVTSVSIYVDETSVDPPAIATVGFADGTSLDITLVEPPGEGVRRRLTEEEIALLNDL